MLHDAAQDNDDEVEPLYEMALYAKTSLFVILNRNNGLISLDAAIPVNFRTETAGGMFTLPIDQPKTIPTRFLEIIRQGHLDHQHRPLQNHPRCKADACGAWHGADGGRESGNKDPVSTRAALCQW